MGTPAAEWLAAKIDELAGLARLVGARTPAEYEDRIDVMERGRAVGAALATA
jgi:hypothetical protein